MRFTTFFLSLAASALARAAALEPDSSPNPEAVFARAPGDAVCKKPAIVVVTLVLKAFPSPASKVCSSILKRTPPTPVTVTSSVTATATATSYSTATQSELPCLRTS